MSDLYRAKSLRCNDARDGTRTRIPVRVPDPKIGAVIKRFWDRVQKSDGCWEWTGNLNEHGYGRTRTGQGRRVAYAHRMSWTLAHGLIPSGMNVCHQCDNRKCVNPLHLFLGTQRDNMRDCLAKGRLRNLRAERQRFATHCKHGHELVGENMRVRSDGSRRCVPCSRNRARSWSQKRRESDGIGGSGNQNVTKSVTRAFVGARA